MIFQREEDIWNAVKKLEGKTLYTFVELKKNYIIKVEDSNNSQDKIIIEDRLTAPIREDIISAYKFLFTKGSLKRLPDLEWLAQPNKKTSCIVFKIISEICSDEIEIISGLKNYILKVNK